MELPPPSDSKMAGQLRDKLKRRREPDEKDDDGAEMMYPVPIQCSTLPDGRRVKDLSADELAAALADLEIPGARKSNSKEASQALYFQHVYGLFVDGGKLNVTMWRLEKGDDSDRNKDDED